MLKIALVGPGKVGTALLHLLTEYGGYEAGPVLYRGTASRKKAEKFLSAAFSKRPSEEFSLADLVILSVRDAEIRLVCDQLAEWFRPGQAVVHVSGSLGTDVLVSAASAGASTGCFHPIQACPSIEDAIRNIPGSYIGITGGNRASTQLLKRLAKAIGCTPIVIDEDQKLLYHASCVLASNYLVALAEVSSEVMSRTSVGDDALEALIPLMKGTIDNIEARGTTRALTGPIARGDCETVNRHLEVLESGRQSGQINGQISPERIYKALGLAALELAVRPGGPLENDPKSARRIHQLLTGAAKRPKSSSEPKSARASKSSKTKKDGRKI